VRVRSLGITVALLLFCGPLSAQTMRSFETFRQLHGETRLAARLEYAAGSLHLAPGRASELYRMDLAYDETRFVPVSDFDPSSGSVFLGLRAAGEGGVRVVSRNQLRQIAAVAISPRVDVALDLTLGATEADLELGGLRVTNLQLKSGASRTVVRFSKANGTRCQRASISAGAADVSVIGLGNSRCDLIEFEGGVGKVLLDFAGAWTANAQVEVNMAMGELTLRLPRRVGVRVSMDKFLSTFEPAGLVRRGDAFQSPNYDSNQRHLDLDLTTAVGGVNVEWVE
jgi:hypothetical protein